MIPEDLNLDKPIKVNVLIQIKRDQPAIELRTLTTNPEIMKYLISAAAHAKPVVILPSFTDPIASLNSLIQKGIIYRDGEEFYFNI